MLPFMKKQRQMSGITTEYRKPDDSEKKPEDSGLEMAAEDMIKAYAANDKKALAAALKAAFEILDSEPHVEGPHEE